MPALTFDDLIGDAPAPTERQSRALTFDDLIAPSKPEPSYLDQARDFGRGIVNGLDRGVASIAGLPSDVARLAIAASDLENSYRTGRPYKEVRDSRDAAAPVSSTFFDRYGGASIHEGSSLRMDPETRLGRAADTVASFVPGALASGGLGSVRSALGTVAAPGGATLVAQGANSVLGIEGAPAAFIEGGAALAGGLGGALATRTGQAERAVTQAASGATASDYRAAQALMDAANSMGVRLTGDEALQQVTGNATRLSELRRVVENSRGGGDVLKPLMAERPGQVRQAGEAATDALGPAQALDPTRTGLAVNRAANAEIQGTQDAINTATRPAYQAAEVQRIGDIAHAGLLRDPLYARTLNEIRNDPALNRTVAQLPDDSVGVIDLVRRRMREQADNAAVPGQASTSNTIAANYTDAMRGPTAAAEAATGGPQGSYATARAAQERLRRQELEPLTAGPVGRLAKSEDAAQQARGLLPNAPQAGAEAGVADAVRRVATRDPQAAQSLIRGHVRTAFDEATQDLASGANQFGGAKFASIVAGNGQQARNLEAAVRALPNGDQRWDGFRRFLDVMEATGKRPQTGSATAFNQEIQRELKQGGIAGEAATAVKTGGLSLVKRFTEFREQLNAGRNSTQIANLLTRPDAARILGQLAETPEGAARAQILALRLSYMGRQGGSKED